MNNKQDTVDSIRTGGTVQPPPPPAVVIVSSQTSSTIDYRELYLGKLVGSGEFAGNEHITKTKIILLNFFLLLEVYEGTYRKARVAIKVLKEPTSASLFLHEADIMR